MIHEEKKAAKILEELTMYFLAVGATDIHTGICREKEQMILRFDSDYHPDYEEELQSLEKYLKEPRNDGMEDIYWELAGSGNPGETSQLLLIGRMTDKAEIRRENARVYLTLTKRITG